MPGAKSVRLPPAAAMPAAIVLAIVLATVLATIA